MIDIKKSLSKNERIRYFVRFFRNLNNINAIYDMNHIYENPESFFVEHRGNANKGMLILPLVVDQKDDGFWAIMRRVLAGLYYARENGMIPVVEWTFNIPYAERPGFMGTDNPFEYYFNPITVNDWKNSCSVVRTKEISGGYTVGRLYVAFVWVENKFGGNYSMTDEYISEMSKIWKDYISFNDITVTKVCNTGVIAEITAHKTLGVHVRGTDFKDKNAGHPVCVEEKEHIKYARELIQNKGYDRIFLATDEERIIGEFADEFGDMVICYDDILRSVDGRPVHLSGNERKDHGYLLGIEILKDSYALASCTGLICGMSQVSNGVRIIKQSEGLSFEDLVIIDRGLN